MPSRELLQIRDLLISHVGPVHPDAQVHRNSATGGRVEADFKFSIVFGMSAFRLTGFPIELMPRIPLTAIDVLDCWLSSNPPPNSYFLNDVLYEKWQDSTNLTFKIHVPPFLHGWVAHGCSTISQRSPERPSAQVHRYWSGAVFSHVPPCIQGSWVPQ